ncbi:MAG: Spy/CpxP family protein refolding chaperone [Neptuniibacter sp.]
MSSKMTAAFVMILAMLGGKSLASESSTYAGEEAREIKSLSKAEVDSLLSGKGMGYAKAAELNGYPGPAHVLELSKKLSLSADQRRETETIFSQMKASAKDLGAELVAAERALDEGFRSKKIDKLSLSKLVEDIGNIESRLRAIHLSAHLQQTKILNDEQISEYMNLRGYNRTGHGSHHKHHHGK